MQRIPPGVPARKRAPALPLPPAIHDLIYVRRVMCNDGPMPTYQLFKPGTAFCVNVPVALAYALGLDLPYIAPVPLVIYETMIELYMEQSLCTEH